MTNRPKAIGTSAETAVTRFARSHGFPHAERRALAGAADVGDILLCPGVILEVKGGAAAELASDLVVRAWLRETERERVNAGAAVALLVTKRRGYSAIRAGDWWAHLTIADLLGHVTGTSCWVPESTLPAAVRLRLTDAFALMRSVGYGEPLEDAS